MTTAVLETRDLRAAYGKIKAVDGVSITVGDGEAVTLIGANGAGKTTLMRTLAGLMRPAGGTVRVDGRDVTGWPAERMVREGVILVPEGRQVFAGLSVRDNLLVGAYRRRADTDVAGDLEDVHRLFPVLQDRHEQLAGTLSGGEQQMLAIGRGLMARPRILLLDEPSLGLAPLAVREVVDRLVDLRERGTTLLLVEQNARAAMHIAQRGYVLQRGRVVISGTTEELLADPRMQAAYLGGLHVDKEQASRTSGPRSPTGNSND